MGVQTSPGPEVIKLFPYSTQLSMEFILLINVGILSFISRINTLSERHKTRNFFNFRYYGQLKFRAQLTELSMKKSHITLGPAHKSMILSQTCINPVNKLK